LGTNTATSVSGCSACGDVASPSAGTKRARAAAAAAAALAAAASAAAGGAPAAAAAPCAGDGAAPTSAASAGLARSSASVGRSQKTRTWMKTCSWREPVATAVNAVGSGSSAAPPRAAARRRRSPLGKQKLATPVGNGVSA
jgi:hypothetical protein